MGCGLCSALTLPAASQGFTFFGWLNPAEEPGGAQLGAAPAQRTHADGAFLYGRADGSHFFYALHMPVDRTSGVRGSRAGSIFINTSGQGRALDAALRKAAVNLQEMVRNAHEQVKQLIREEVRGPRRRMRRPAL